MQLTPTGAIKIDGHLARFTDDGKWMVSRFETIIGYADSLAEVSPLIAQHKERVRARLALVQRKAEERRIERLAQTTGHSLGMILDSEAETEVDEIPPEIVAATKQ